MAEREAGAVLTMEEVGPAPAMVAQPVQQQQASAARGAAAGVRVFALDGQGFECATDSDEASLWVVTDGQASRDCASYAEALDLAEESRDLGHVPAAY